MSSFLAPWGNDLEPNQTNIRYWLDNIFTKFMPVEQCRWNQSNIDTLFYAGAQDYVNRYFQFSPTTSYQKYYFNMIQQPVNIITGYQRQHRKSITYSAREGADSNTTDQYTRIITDVCDLGGIHESFSKSCELSAISGMNLIQPYLDYNGEDPAQGDLKIKVWEYNSFIVDPYFRNADMSDAQFVWCQEYITYPEAKLRFGDRIDRVSPSGGNPQRFGNFYFLPENQNLTRNDMFVLSYVWYKSHRKKKRLYSRKRNQFFDFAGGDPQLEMILYHVDDMKPVVVDCPTWKVCVVLNDQMMFNGVNPLGFDQCPFIPVFWNYDPHINVPDLRCRSLVRPMRDPQFLFNYKIITNNDIAAATINAGWKRKVGAVANEDNLKKSGQGFDVIVNEGYELTDVEKIIPSAVPQSDLELAQQMADLIYNTSGIQMENWSGQNDSQISSLTMLLKQAANLLVFQKYFDQWDFSLKLLGDTLLDIVLNNWNESKVHLFLGEEPSPHFYSKIFAKYKTVVSEGLLTPTQKNLQAQQMLDINTTFGREVIPASMIIKDMNIQGKSEIIEFLQQQEKSMQESQAQQQAVEHAFEDAKLQELYSKAASNLATARERHGRAQSDIGLYEERLSEITRNRALATKDKMAALAQLVETIEKFGSFESRMAQNEIQNSEMNDILREDKEKNDAQRTSFSNEFVQKLLGQANEIQARAISQPNQEIYSDADI